MPGDMDYPISERRAAGVKTAYQDLARLIADAVYLGKIAKDAKDNDAGGDPQAVTLGGFFDRYLADCRLEYLAANKIRIGYSANRPPVVMCKGFMLKAVANVDLASAVSGGAGLRYIFANRNVDSTTFTITSSDSAVEGAAQRVIGELYWDGSDIDQDSIVSYETEGFGITPSHDSIIKAWVSFDGAGTIQESYNIFSVSRWAAGRYIVTIDEDMDSAVYAVLVTPEATVPGIGSGDLVVAKTVGVLYVATANAAGTYVDMPCNVAILGERT